MVSEAIEDPREIVTEHAFRVAPALLGRPLAGGWRRLVGLGVDGLLVVLLANAPSLIFAVAVLAFVWRISIRPTRRGFIRRSAHLATRVLLAVVAFAAVLSIWDIVTSFGEDEESDPGEAIELTGIQGMAAVGTLLAAREADTPEESAAAIDRMIREFEGMGVEGEDILEMLEEFPVSDDQPWADSLLSARTEAYRAELYRPAPAMEPDSADALVARYQTALEQGDTIAQRELEPALTTRFAGDSIGRLLNQLESSSEDVDELQDELDQASDRGILATLRTFLEDIGLTFGWGSLYFTGFITLWQGQTPGKRLLGMRVVRLDGAPIGWWQAFERFAGYAAGLATGLLGFAQIFWDRNRQAIQDKIAGTVVIRERGGAPASTAPDSSTSA